jgi:hypothetical protein
MQVRTSNEPGELREQATIFGVLRSSARQAGRIFT